MSGIIIAGKDRLSADEITKYNAYHCGLCRALREAGGVKAKAMLSYDMTYIYILLSSIYENEPVRVPFNCAFHPLSRHTCFSGDIARYTADMTILLSYSCMLCASFRKGSHEQRFVNSLSDTIKQLETRYPVQSGVCRKSSIAIRNFSKRNEENEQLPACRVGEVFGASLQMRNDEWSHDLYDVGFYLGQFAFLMGAHLSRIDDKYTGRYNPLILKEEKDPNGYESAIRANLKSLINEAEKSLERLPLKHDEAILRNTLESGVWQKYNSTNNKLQKHPSPAHHFFI